MEQREITGSIEVLIGGGETLQSYGIPVVAATLAEVPVVVKVRHGITGLVPVADPDPINGRTPVAVWTAQTADGQTVRTILWEDVPFDETVIGKALTDALPAE